MADSRDLAERIVRAMDARGYALDRGTGELNIVYVEGVTIHERDGTLVAESNGNKPNLWNDARIVIRFAGNIPVVVGWWQATTEPGTRYTNTPINEGGAARITLGQQKCWQVGLHRGYEALAQTGDVVMVTRDKNKDFARTGDKVTKGFYGINQHHGFDAPENNIGPHSAGCLVGRTVAGHREFMALLKTDPRYVANRKHVFATTVLEAKDLASDTVALPLSRPDAKAPARMILKLTPANLRQCFPKAPTAIIEAFASKEGTAALAKAGILDTPRRLAYCFANLAHETGDWTIKDLTENINYTHARAAQVWPNRFPGGQGAVVAKYGTAPGWQLKMFDDVYGNRMGNVGAHDGSSFIGRGGPQVTGRDGYREVGKRAGLDLEGLPELAARPEDQPAIAAAFWTWKGMNRFADAGDFLGCVKAWNGGTNGLADRQAKLARIQPVADRMDRVPFMAEAVAAVVVTTVGAGAVAANEIKKPQTDWSAVALGIGATLVIVVAVVAIIRHYRKG